MSADKRTVATDALETLGTIIDDKQKRDAINIAVEPVIAGERLRPGDHITVLDGVAFSADADSEDPPLGIVDPFLRKPVKKGQRFWFLMYPGKVLCRLPELRCGHGHRRDGQPRHVGR